MTAPSPVSTPAHRDRARCAPEPQELVGVPAKLDLRLPALLVERRPPMAPFLVGALGAAALSTTVVAASGFAAAPAGAGKPWFPMLLLSVLGVLVVASLAPRLLRSRSILFEQERVSGVTRGPLGEHEWSLPYSAFRGVHLRTVTVASRHGGGRTYRRIELAHHDLRYSVLLMQSEAGKTHSDAQLERECEAFARTLGVPRIDAAQRWPQRLPIVGHLF